MNVHIHRVETKEYSRKDVGTKWCFGCRKHLPHELVVYVPVDPMSYYGPHTEIQCSRCHKDRTLFPGYERVWDEEE